jgi:KEOPS complex subunit Cgi121
VRVVEGRASVDDVDAFVADLTAVADAHGVTVQAFDARYVVSRNHLERAVELADRAFERGENVARDRGVEILLYVAGRRQIDRALSVGVSPGEGPVVVVVDDPDASDTRAAEGRPGDGDGEGGAEAAAAAAVADLLAPAETLGEFETERVREFYDVGAAELAAVEGGLADVVLERVALLDVEK